MDSNKEFKFVLGKPMLDSTVYGVLRYCIVIFHFGGHKFPKAYITMLSLKRLHFGIDWAAPPEASSWEAASRKLIHQAPEHAT